MNKVKVVTAYVPLPVTHLSTGDYHELGERLFNAVGQSKVQFYDQQPLDRCWAYQLLKDLKPATETPADRYPSPEVHVMSHIVQHSRTQWALRAAADGEADVIVWLDLGIMKQGRHTGKHIRITDVQTLIERVEQYDFTDIPFPGIEGSHRYDPLGNNWRFCGSTHIWPVKWLGHIDRSYRFCLRQYVRQHGVAPLDLAIWPMVEKVSGLPFKWYKADYDRTQLTEFPCASLSQALQASLAVT
jgi:hypothetical protein